MSGRSGWRHDKFWKNSYTQWAIWAPAGHAWAITAGSSPVKFHSGPSICPQLITPPKKGTVGPRSGGNITKPSKTHLSRNGIYWSFVSFARSVGEGFLAYFQEKASFLRCHSPLSEYNSILVWPVWHSWWKKTCASAILFRRWLQLNKSKPSDQKKHKETTMHLPMGQGFSTCKNKNRHITMFVAVQLRKQWEYHG